MKTKYLLTGGLIAILLASAVGVAYAYNDDGVIHACVKDDGQVRIVRTASDCKDQETHIHWNVLGPVGPKGAKGDTGPQGPAGPEGAKGDIGLQGPQGIPGPQGEVGTQGPQGEKGDRGPAGPQGLQGEQGLPGNLALANRTCPPNKFVSGFAADGSLICGNFEQPTGEPPTATPTDTPIPTDTPTPEETPPPHYWHSIEIDGVNDFLQGETFLTTSTEYTGFISWDMNYLSLGIQGPAVADPYAYFQQWVIYLDGYGEGALHGVLPYVGSETILPFPAEYAISYNLNGETHVFRYEGSEYHGEWLEIDIPSFYVARRNNFVEMHVAWLDLYSPETIKFTSGIVQQANPLWIFGGMPSTSFIDGPNPYFTKYFEFDLNSNMNPNEYVPLP